MSRPATAMPWLYGHLRRRAALYAAVAVLFAAGAVAGALSAGDINPQHRQELTLYVRQVQQSLDARPELADLLRRATWEHGVRTVGLMWLLGLSLIGAPFILGIVFMRGFGLGFTAAFLVKEGVLPGLALTLAGVTPHHLFLIPGVLLAGGAALSFSAVAAAIIMGRRQLSAFSQFVATTLLCGLGFGLLVAGSLVEAYMTPVLIKAVGFLIDLW